MVMIMMMMTMVATITPAMAGMSLLSIDNGVVVPSVVGLTEDGTVVDSLVVVVLGDETIVVISPEVDVSDGVTSIVEAVAEDSKKGIPMQCENTEYYNLILRINP